MPDYNDKPGRVIDAFAFSGRVPLFAEIDVDLTEDEQGLVHQLVERVPYLGRAESWITGAITSEHFENQQGYIRVIASQRSPDPGGAQEPVKTLGMLSPGAYLEWRIQQLKLESVQTLERERHEAKQKGKSVPNELSRKSLQKLEAALPSSVVECLYAETADLHKQGWSQPPGTQWLTYWVPDNILQSRQTASTPRKHLAPAQAILFALSSNTSKGEVLPPFKDALLRGELFHRAVISRAEAPISPLLTGIDRDGEPLQGHQHIHYMPLCLRETRRTLHASQRRVDHILAWSSKVLDRESLLALSSVTRLFSRKDLPTIFVTVAGSGMLDDLKPHGNRGIPELATSRVWRSSTPFVPPRFLKASSKNSLIGQVVSEVVARGISKPIHVEVEIEDAGAKAWVPAEEFWKVWKVARGEFSLQPSDATRQSPRLLARDWRFFRRERLDGKQKPPIALGVGLRLTFEEPVIGPLCLGYGCHFGLGVFVPE